MLRARFRLGPLALGLLIVVTEFGFALYSVASIHRWMQPRGLGTLPVSLTPSFYGPVVLLGLATIIGAVVLHRAASNWLGWRWYAAAFAPAAVFLLLYRPPVSHFDDRVLRVHDAGLPWAGPVIWGTSALAFALQIALYVAAASYVTSVVLGALVREPKLQRTATIPWSGSRDTMP